MSVHSEYGRALEALLIGLQRLDTPDARDWETALIMARASLNPDLSTAAMLCERVLDAIDRGRSLSRGTEIGPDLDPPTGTLSAFARPLPRRARAWRGEDRTRLIC